MPDVPAWLAAVVVLVGAPSLVFIAVFYLALRRARKEAAEEQAKIDRRLAQTSGLPRMSHGDSLRALAEYGDRREAELRAKGYGPKRKGAA